MTDRSAPDMIGSAGFGPDAWRREGAVDWPTLWVMAATYLVWVLALWVIAPLSVPLAILVLSLAVTQHSSLQHEVLHGHPFRLRWLNELLVSLPVGLCFPYGRFRDTHLAHHRDELLTDPYDGPESNFMDPAVWERQSRGRRMLLRWNNTLLGRMAIGPALGVTSFAAQDLAAIRAGDRAILRDWILHVIGLVVVFWIVAQSPMPVWAYLIGAYLGLSLLKIRTYLEHRAHLKARCRTVVVERGGPGPFAILPFLFLNNNLHVVHHAKPNVAWYHLPALYRAGREDWLKRNETYVYPSYAAIFRAHLVKAKDPVPHPLYPPKGQG